MLSGRVDGRSAVGTEELEPPAAVVGALYVKSGRTGRDLEPVAVCADGHSIRGAGQPLAVGTVADCDVLRVDLGFIRDLSALACAIDVHVRLHSLLLL